MEEEEKRQERRRVAGKQAVNRVYERTPSLPRMVLHLRENSFTMFVSTITEETSKTELEDMFCRAGKILDSFLSIDKHSGKKRGFAFIGFGSIQEAKRAVEIARGRSWGGRKIQAQLSKFKQGANATQRNAY